MTLLVAKLLSKEAVVVDDECFNDTLTYDAGGVQHGTGTAILDVDELRVILTSTVRNVDVNDDIARLWDEADHDHQNASECSGAFRTRWMNRMRSCKHSVCWRSVPAMTVY